MTSIPASRRVRATTFTPRSWPSRPTFANRTRINCCIVLLTSGPAHAGRVANVVVQLSCEIIGGVFTVVARQTICERGIAPIDRLEDALMFVPDRCAHAGRLQHGTHCPPDMAPVLMCRL